MADNLAITPGFGATAAADEISGVLHQRIKLSLGADGIAFDALGGAGVVSSAVQRVTLASDDPAVAHLAAIEAAVEGATPAGSNTIGTVSLTDISAAEYETVAASQTDQALGATGATGDYLAGVLIVPATVAAGAVSIKDGAGSAISLYPGGATTPLLTLHPFFVPLGIKSTGGAWKVTTGTNVSAIAVGNFT